MAAPTPPFAVSDAELTEVEGFCKRNGLDQIGKICAELRTMRREFMDLSKRAGRQRAMVETAMPDPNRRFAAEMDRLTDGAKDAPTVP